MALELVALIRTGPRGWVQKHEPVLVPAEDLARRWAALKAWVDEDPGKRSFYANLPGENTGLSRKAVDRLVAKLDDEIKTRNALIQYAYLDHEPRDLEGLVSSEWEC